MCFTDYASAKIIAKNSKKYIDKHAVASYNIYIIKQNHLIKSRERGRQMGKKKKKKQKEKELLEQRLLKTQWYESLAAIVATIVTMLLAIVTAVITWFSK